MAAEPTPIALSVVIPALNEAERLPRTLEQVYAYLGGCSRWLPAEVVVVDDGSVDQTAAAAAAVLAPSTIDLVLQAHDRFLGKTPASMAR